MTSTSIDLDQQGPAILDDAHIQRRACGCVGSVISPKGVLDMYLGGCPSGATPAVGDPVETIPYDRDLWSWS